MTCMIDLQEFRREDIIRERFGSLDKDSDMEALVSFIGSQSNGMTMNVPLQCVGVLSVFEHAAARAQRLSHACQIAHVVVYLVDLRSPINRK